MASKPLNMNSNNVFKFSGLGAVTKMFEYLFQCNAEIESVSPPRLSQIPHLKIEKELQ